MAKKKPIKSSNKPLILSAKNMKRVLWETLGGIKAGTIDPADADAIASQSREIIRVIKTQQGILQQAKKTVNKELVDYATA